MADLVAGDGYLTAGTYNIDSLFGRGLINNFVSRFSDSAIGGSIEAIWQKTHVENLNPGENVGDAEVVLDDLTSIFAAFASSGKPAALVVNSLPGINIAVIEKWEALGTPGALYMSFTAFSQDIIDTATVSDTTLNKIRGITYAIGGGQNGAQFLTDYVQVTGQAQTAFIDTYYDAVMMFALAAVASGSTNPSGEDIQNGMKLLNSADGTIVGYGSNEFKRATDILLSGGSINYEGVSGSLDHDMDAKNAGCRRLQNGGSRTANLLAKRSERIMTCSPCSNALPIGLYS